MNDLWPDLSDISKQKTPQKILTEQANALSDKTGNLIVGQVKKLRSIRRGRQELEYPFMYDFIIRADILNYSYSLFSIGHDIYLYPVYFIIDKDIKLEILGSEEALVAKDEEEFITILRKIFNSQKTVKILKAILSQIES